MKEVKKRNSGGKGRRKIIGQKSSKGGGRNGRGCEMHCILKKLKRRRPNGTQIKEKRGRNIKLNYKEEKKNSRGFMKNIW